MDDLISRQAAIDALKHNQDVYSHNFHDDPIDKYTTAIIAADIDSLVNLPSAQPERIKGKWQWLASTYDRTPCEMRFRCSACHHETITHGSDPWEKFCPNCGADMQEKGENG